MLRAAGPPPCRPSSLRAGLLHLLRRRYHTVCEIEARNIRRHYGNLFVRSLPQAPGKCAFLDDPGRFRIYEHRPYVCRTQGLPIRRLEEDGAGEYLEMRDICPLNKKGPPMEELPDDAC